MPTSSVSRSSTNEFRVVWVCGPSTLTIPSDVRYYANKGETYIAHKPDDMFNLLWNYVLTDSVYFMCWLCLKKRRSAIRSNDKIVDVCVCVYMYCCRHPLAVEVGQSTLFYSDKKMLKSFFPRSTSLSHTQSASFENPSGKLCTGKKVQCLSLGCVDRMPHTAIHHIFSGTQQSLSRSLAGYKPHRQNLIFIGNPICLCLNWIHPLSAVY